MRKPLRKFARFQEKILKQNDYKRPRWDKLRLIELLDRLEDEVIELKDALLMNNYEQSQKECADIANYAMMIYDKRNRIK